MSRTPHPLTAIQRICCELFEKAAPRGLAAVLALLPLAGCSPTKTPPAPLIKTKCGPVDSGSVDSGPHSDPLTHILRGDGPSFIEILDVVQAYPILYACTAVQGLSVWNADSGSLLAGAIAPPGLAGGSAGQYPHCQHVALDVDQSKLIITNRGDETQPQPFMHLFDVMDPSAPQPLGGWTGPEAIEGAVLQADRVYAAAHQNGVMVLRVEDDFALTEVARFADADSDAWQVVIHQGHLLVAEGAHGLRIYRLNGDQPELLASVPIAGSSKDVVVHDNVAYVAASSTVAAVDISDVAYPQLLDEVATAGTAVALAIGLNDTLLVAEWEKVRGYDISDPRDLKLELSETPPTNSSHARVLALDANPHVAQVYAGEWTGLHSYAQSACGVGPDIEISPDYLTFPTLSSNQSLTQNLTFSNRGNRPLLISDIDVTNEAITFDDAPLSIAPGASVDLPITFQPSDNTPILAQLRIISNDLDESPLGFGISGNLLGVNVGSPMPSFSLMDTEGVAYNSAQLKGKVVLLAYFATF